MKTITIEEIYADPHVLDSLLTGSESVEIVQLGEPVAKLTPKGKPSTGKTRNTFNAAEHRAWFLKAYGPDAYNSKRSVADLFEQLRS